MPEKPMGYDFIVDFSKKSNISVLSIYDWLMSGKLGGEIQRFNNPSFYRKKYSYALSPEQQKNAILRKRSKEKRLAKMPKKPEKYEFLSDFAEKYDVEYNSLRNWLASGKLGGEINNFRNPAQKRTGFSCALSPEQQKVALRFFVIIYSQVLNPLIFHIFHHSGAFPPCPFSYRQSINDMI